MVTLRVDGDCSFAHALKQPQPIHLEGCSESVGEKKDGHLNDGRRSFKRFERQNNDRRLRNSATRNVQE